jgi:hypothetical protein
VVFASAHPARFFASKRRGKSYKTRGFEAFRRVFYPLDREKSPQKFDKISLSGRSELLLLSVVTEIHNLKRMRAILLGGAKAQINAAGIRVGQPVADSWRMHQPGRVNATQDGYQLHTHKLGYGMIHALFLTRMPGFMKVVTPESLWQELNKERYTTPIIRSWMPYIETRLRDQEYLEDAHVFNCKCGVLSALTKHLDEIVCEGIKSGELLITESYPETVPQMAVA